MRRPPRPPVSSGAAVGGKGANLARLVAAGMPVPDGFCVTTALYRTLVDHGGIQDRIRGLAALDSADTAAIAEGTARAVRDPAEETIEPGEILVAPSSDPGRTPLFLNAAGMVVEVGGRMSHGSLVAREYGLPAVVSVTGATRSIETGQRLRIDRTRGIVEVVDDGARERDAP